MTEKNTRGEGEGWLQRSYNLRAQKLVLGSIEVQLPLEKIYERVEWPKGLASRPSVRESDF